MQSRTTKLELPKGWRKRAGGHYESGRLQVRKYNRWGCPWHVLKDGDECGAGFHTAREAIDAATRWRGW